MFHKDTLRLIKKTFKRFLTIFLMVTIGVSFMVGLLASKPIMHKSVDIYYDEYEFMDVQLYSSYGFGEEDINVLKKEDFIEEIFATKFVDAFGSIQEDIYVTRAQEIDANVNQFELVSGRMPENENEALTLGSEDFGTLIEEGETITLYLEDSEISDSLESQEFTIVGTVKSPQYMAKTKEPSTLNNLDLEVIIYVDNDLFISDYYTSAYLTFKNSKDYISFTDEYKDFIEENVEKLELVADKQEGYRKEEVLKEALEEIEKGEKELEEKIGDAQKEIDKGVKELNSAYQQILDGEKEIKENEKKLADGLVEIEENENKLEQAKQEILDAKALIEDEMGSSFDDAVNTVEQLYTIYTTLEDIKENATGDVKVSERINENLLEIAELEKENAQYELEIVKLKLTSGNEIDILQLEAKISMNDVSIAAIQSENRFLSRVLNLYEDSPIDGILSLLDSLANGSVKETYAGIQQLIDGEKQIEDGLKQLESAKKEIENGKKQIEQAKLELENGKKQYYAGKKKLEDAQETLDEEYEKARIEIEKAKQQVEELPDAGWMILDRDSHYSTAMYDGNATQMGTIGTVFPMLFFLVAALVCMTTMKRLVDEQRNQIGVFSALGFSKNQIISKYVIYAFLASALGSIPGLLSGIPIFPNVIFFCWRLMYDLPATYLYLPFSAALIGASSFTLLMSLVTYLVARSSLKEVPSQLLRPKAPKKAKKVFLENISFVWNRLSFTSKVTARNLIRYKSRFFMTVCGVAGCTSLLVLGFGIKDCISNNVDIQFGEVFKYQYTVNLEDNDYLESAKDILIDEYDVENALPLMTYSSKVYLDEEVTIAVNIFDENQVEDIMDLRTRKKHKPLSLDNGVVISEKFATENNLSVGDEIKIESSNGIKKDVEISGICEMYFQHYLFMTKENYEDTFNETVRYDQLAVISEEDDFVNPMKKHEYVKSITDFESHKESVKSMLEALDIIVVVILGASGALAFIVLVNLTEVNISERMREIATLKVLGFNDQEVNGYIFKEIFLLALIGALVGMPLGKIELGYVMKIIDMDMVMFGTDIKPLSYLYGFMITIVFTVLVMVFMRGSLKKVEMVESLKSVE